MHFAYDGFTHHGDIRCFRFRGIEGRDVTSFSMEIELTLLASNHVPVQDGPSFCLSLLKTALVAGSIGLNRFENYRVIGEDFRPLLIERERKAAEKAKNKPFRPSPRKPSEASHLHFRAPAGGA